MTTILKRQARALMARTPGLKYQAAVNMIRSGKEKPSLHGSLEDLLVQHNLEHDPQNQDFGFTTATIVERSFALYSKEPGAEMLISGDANILCVRAPRRVIVTPRAVVEGFAESFADFVLEVPNDAQAYESMDAFRDPLPGCVVLDRGNGGYIAALKPIGFHVYGPDDTQAWVVFCDRLKYGLVKPPV